MCEHHTARGVVAEHDFGFGPGLARLVGGSGMPARTGPSVPTDVAIARLTAPVAVPVPRPRVETAPIEIPQAVARVEGVRSDVSAPILAILESALTREPTLPVQGQAKKRAVKAYRAQTLVDLAGSLRIRSRLPEMAEMLNYTPPRVVAIVREELKGVLRTAYSDALLPVFMRPGADLRL